MLYLISLHPDARIRIRTGVPLQRSKTLTHSAEGENGWHSGEDSRLPPMWTGFDSRSRRHMWVEFAVGSCPSSEYFRRVLRFSSLHKNPEVLNSSSIWKPAVDEEPLCGYAAANAHFFHPVFYLFYLYSWNFSKFYGVREGTRVGTKGKL